MASSCDVRLSSTLLLLFALGLMVLVTPASAVNRYWIDPNGGFFSLTSNWSATSGGANGASVPGATDIANFDLNNTYTISDILATNPTNQRVDVENGNVTFDLNGDTYTFTDTSGVRVGNVSGQTGRLTIVDGRLAFDTAGDNFDVGTSGSNGFVTIGGGGEVGNGLLDPDFVIGGSNATGSVTVNANGQLFGRTLVLGFSGGTGSLTVTGPRASADISSSSTIGSFGDGNLSVLNGGTLSSQTTVLIGNSETGDGFAQVSGVGSSWTMSSTPTIGSSGEGTLSVSSGGRVVSRGADIGGSAGSDGTATVSGAGSLWEVANILGVGNFGNGLLSISGGGQVIGNSSATIGDNSGSSGRVTVSGTGSRWESRLSIKVGDAGAGELSITSGGQVESNSAFVLGEQSTGAGLLTVSGAGSMLMMSNGILFVGRGGDGTLNVIDGAEVHVTSDLDIDNRAGAQTAVFNLDGGSVFLGDDFINDGEFNFSDGLLQVAGDFNHSSTTLVLDGDDNNDLPTLDLVGSSGTENISTLTVGDNRRGQLQVRQGRSVIANTSIDVAANPGSEGKVVVESGGFLSTNAFALGGSGSSSTGGAATLDINAGGFVNAATFNLWDDGVVNLNGGHLAINTLNFSGSGAGQINWAAGTIEFNQGNTTLTESFATQLLGPTPTLRTGQTLDTLAGQTITVATPIILDGGVFAAANLANNNTIRGTGRVAGALTNNVDGQIELTAGQRIAQDGGSVTNSGHISVIGGELETDGAVTNVLDNGLISARDAILRFNGGVNNAGGIAFSNGTVDVYGDITQNIGGRVTVSNGGIANFYDDVTIAAGGNDVQATALGSTVSRVVFFGAYNGGVSGGGQAFIEGDHRPGNSAAEVDFGGDVLC